MNIIEAAEAAMAGKRVALKENEVRWVNDWLEWKAAGSVVLISKNVLSNDWRIIPDPPKLYPFSEALGMMRQGKWMKSMVSDRVMAVNNTFWRQRTFDSGYSKFIEPTFTVYEIEGQWQEVTE